MRRDAAARGACSCSTARPGAWLPARLGGGRRSAATGSAERLAAAFEDAGGPAFLVGMDTPQVTPGALRRRAARAASDADAAFGPARRTAATGRSACARPTPRVFARRPDERAPTPARRSARGCARSGCAPSSCPPLRDVDDIAAARAVAATPRRAAASPRALREATRRRELTAATRRASSRRAALRAAARLGGRGRRAGAARGPDRRRRARSRCRWAAGSRRSTPPTARVLAHAVAPGARHRLRAGPPPRGARRRRRSTALGLDLSPVAVRLARARGAEAILRSVFADVPRAGTLADRAAARRQHRDRRRARRAARARPRARRARRRGAGRDRRRPASPTRRIRVRLEAPGAISPLVRLGDGRRRRHRALARAAGLAPRATGSRPAGAGSRGWSGRRERRRPGPFRPGVLALAAARPVADRDARLAAARARRRSSRVTGFLSHAAYQPDLGRNALVDPDLAVHDVLRLADGPVVAVRAHAGPARQRRARRRAGRCSRSCGR